MTICSGLGYKPSDPEMSDNEDHVSGEETREQVGGASQIAMMQSLLQQQQTFLEQQEAQQRIMENLIDKEESVAYRKELEELTKPLNFRR